MALHAHKDKMFALTQITQIKPRTKPDNSLEVALSSAYKGHKDASPIAVAFARPLEGRKDLKPMEVKDPTLDATIDLHEPVSGDGQSSNQALRAAQDVAFGSLAGAVGKYIEYPFDTVKVRLQSQASGQPLQYAGPLDCFRQSVARDGVLKGLYRGVSAPVVGAAIETSSLFFSYRIAQTLIHGPLYDAAKPLPMSALCLSGAASGAFTSLLLTPIELIKCKMQVPQQSSGYRPGVFALVASTFRQHGLLGFWRGQLGTLIRETGGSSAWFGSFEGVSALFRTRRRQKALAAGRPDPTDSPLPIHQQLLAGATAGMSYNFVFYPADTIKSRMQTEEVVASRRTTFWSTGRLLWKDQGIRGLYRGCGITVARAAPSSAFIFTIYEALKNAFA